MLRLKILTAILLSNLFVFAQEICNNCIDDNNDGLIDCYDPLCHDKVGCSDFFIKKVTNTCIYYPDFESTFTLQPLWESKVETDTKHTTVTGDIDGDGIPEVVVFGSNYSTPSYNIYILDGATGAVKVTIPDSVSTANDGAAIADIDRDGKGEIFILTFGGYLKCYNYQGVLVWKATVKIKSGIVRPLLADFNADGIPEVYIGIPSSFSTPGGIMIFNSLTGVLIAQGTGSGGESGMGVLLPVAADVLPDNWMNPNTLAVCPDCDGLELVAGNQVYGVDITGGTMTVRSNAPAGLNDGFTSVADFTGDGQLDVIVKGGNSIEVYAWDPRTEMQVGTTFSRPADGIGGPLNIGNYDGDPALEIGIAGKTKYFLLDNDFTPLWEHIIDDYSSNYTGSTAFDFNCDDQYEIVYRDEDSLFIFDGATGATLASAPCRSGTRVEVPVIVDVDGDGSANIVCECSPPGWNGNNGHVVAWKSAANNWPATRKVFNQHNYSVVNINDDLTIPCEQQNHAHPLLPKRLNSFLNQMPLMDENGDKICYIEVIDATITIDSAFGSACEDSITVNITVCNNSDKLMPHAAPISFYNGNPLSGGTYIQTINTPVIIQANSCETFSYNIANLSGLTDLYAYVNDTGNVNSPPVAKYIECDYTNNFSFNVVTTAMPTLNIGPDASVCSGTSVTLTSFVSGIPNSSYLWSNGAIAPSTIIAPTTTSSYSLSVSNPNCTITDSVTLTVYEVKADFVANPSSGIAPLKTTMIDSSTNAFTYYWTFNDVAPETSTDQNPTHEFLEEGDYEVNQIVTDINGCQDTISQVIHVIGSVSLYYPNTFTPNGDGTNETFSIQTSNVTQLKASIYDRWGNLIYTWTTLDGGWDGTSSGEGRGEAQEDVYVLFIDYLTNDNINNKITDKIILIR